MSAAIDGNVRARLARILAMLSSPSAGERDAAAIAARDLVERHGLRWADVLEPASPRQKIDDLFRTNLDWTASND